MFEFEVAPGAKVPAGQSHDAYDETTYGLERILTYTVNGQAMEGPPETPSSSLAESFTASKASTLLRQKRSRSSLPASSAQITFSEIAGVLQSTPPGTPPNAAAIGEIMRRHVLTRPLTRLAVSVPEVGDGGPPTTTR
jgi:hypothetical protein